ncbi:MAG: hypothetical protein RLZZ01_735, partial [Actinomycetota bacterium]
EMIRRAPERFPHVDVFLLNEHDTPRRLFEHVAERVITDPDEAPRRHLPIGFEHVGTPSILSKTVHALDVLADRYDVFFRTNLSSVLLLGRLDRYVQEEADLCYSGGLVWPDALRADLERHGRVGPGRSIESMADLDGYPGNSFVSGSGFFLSATEARSLVAERDRLRYDLPDDVAIGLMMRRCRLLDGFSERILATTPVAEVLDRIEFTSATHIRLEHFPVERAMAVWRYLDTELLWR